MANIRIIAIPSGKQPKCEREKLKGLILPTAEDAPKEKFSRGYPVNTEKVIEALETEDWQAAQWWRKYVNPTTTKWIFFDKEVCQLV